MEAVDKTFPRPLTRLLNGESVKLPSKLAEPWSAFQKLKASERLGGRVRSNMPVAVDVWKACDRPLPEKKSASEEKEVR